MTWSDHFRPGDDLRAIRINLLGVLRDMHNRRMDVPDEVARIVVEAASELERAAEITDDAQWTSGRAA